MGNKTEGRVKMSINIGGGRAKRIEAKNIGFRSRWRRR